MEKIKKATIINLSDGTNIEISQWVILIIGDDTNKPLFYKEFIGDEELMKFLNK